ncbi:MAG: hypothetical protein KBS95_06625 [Alistipes sp.]|nr:hypothetical protein [Candidatus Alistipes equi]
MKKLLILSLCVLTMSCVKDTTSDIDSNLGLNFKASFESLCTRTQLNSELKQSWTKNDCISIFSTEKNEKYVFNGETGAKQALFTKADESAAGVKALQRNYALYPYFEGTTISDDGKLLVTLPSTQQLQDGTFGVGTNLMSAQTSTLTDHQLNFKNVCGYVLLNLYAENFTLKELRLKGNDQEVLAGSAKVSFDTEGNPEIEVLEGGATEIVLTSEQGLKLSSSAQTANEFWVVLPPREYAHGFTIEMIDQSGNHMKKTTGKAITIARNQVIDMREVNVDSCLSGEYQKQTARWEMTSTLAKNMETTWRNENRLYATNEQGKGVAYISTEAGDNSSEPQRGRDGNTLAISNLKQGDCINLTYPGVTAKKGSTVDVMCSMYSSSKYIPKYWLFEYWEDGKWNTVEEDLHPSFEDPNLKFTMYLYSSDSQKTNFVQSFTLKNDIVNGEIKVRLRAVGNINSSGGALTPTAGAYVILANTAWNLAEIDIYQGHPIRDTKKILVLGNSFTQYQSSNFILKRLARSQGHEIRMRPFMKGGQTVGQHLNLEMSKFAVDEGGYDYSIIQDQSTQHAKYYSDPSACAYVLEDTKTLLANIKAKSPNVIQILENTWGYLGASNYEGYGSMENMDALLQCGTLALSKLTSSVMSPIGVAFQRARAQGINTLYGSDNKHPSRHGAYLKSCVNYLLIYGQRFDENVPDCDLDAQLAKKLRDIAEDVVIGGYEIKYFVIEDPTKVSFTTEGGEGSVAVSTNLEYEVSCEKDWVHLEKLPEMVKWTIDQNTEKSSRGATIRFVPNGADEKTISIVQAGTEAPGGISSKEEMIDFMNLVNSKADFSKYMDPDGSIILKADIDMAGVDWIPIGSSQNEINYTVSAAPTDPFKGVFDGKGHKIKNLSLKLNNNKDSYMGFFGATQDAQIKNVTFENLDMEFTTKGIASNHVAYGGVVGYAYDTQISNVNVTVTSHGKATSTASRAVSYGSIVGILFASGEYKSRLDYCTASGEYTNNIGLKYSNGSTSQMGGILGAVSNKSKLVKINWCTNYCNFEVYGHKCGGVIGNAFSSEIENCKNYGNIHINYSPDAPSSITISGVRTGGIMAYCSSTTTNPSNLMGCSNYGTIASEQDGSAVGGVAGLIRCYKLRECHNLGNVIGPNPSPSGPYRGLLVGAITSADNPSTFESCSLRGWIGSKRDLSDAVEAGEDNYLELGVTIKDDASCPSWNADNIRFALEQ